MSLYVLLFLYLPSSYLILSAQNTWKPAQKTSYKPIPKSAQYILLELEKGSLESGGNSWIMERERDVTGGAIIKAQKLKEKGQDYRQRAIFKRGVERLSK